MNAESKKKIENDYKNIFYCPMKGEDNDNIGIILESIMSSTLQKKEVFT